MLSLVLRKEIRKEKGRVLCPTLLPLATLLPLDRPDSPALLRRAPQIVQQRRLPRPLRNPDRMLRPKKRRQRKSSRKRRKKNRQQRTRHRRRTSSNPVRPGRGEWGTFISNTHPSHETVTIALALLQLCRPAKSPRVSREDGRGGR